MTFIFYNDEESGATNINHTIMYYIYYLLVYLKDRHFVDNLGGQTQELAGWVSALSHQRPMRESQVLNIKYQTCIKVIVYKDSSLLGWKVYTSVAALFVLHKGWSYLTPLST